MYLALYVLSERFQCQYCNSETNIDDWKLMDNVIIVDNISGCTLYKLDIKQKSFSYKNGKI